MVKIKKEMIFKKKLQIINIFSNKEWNLIPIKY